MKRLRQRTPHPASGNLLPIAEKEGDGIAASERYLDKVAVAKRLGVKPKTVAEWANQGKLPAYRLGPFLRFKWAEVEQHLAVACRVAKEEQKAESREK